MIADAFRRPARLPREIPIQAIDAADLAHLAQLGVPEGQQLEYKRELWAKSRDGCREMLKDISAFANAEGGDLIVGIEEADGGPHALLGLAVDKPDELLRGLQDQLSTGVEPPISGVRIRWVPIADDRLVLLVRVPSSLSGPHRNLFSKEFHVRSNTMVSAMGVQQLREMFVGTDRLVERLRVLHRATFEQERPELPFIRSNDATAVMSLLPLDLFRARRDLDITFGNAVKPPMRGPGGMDYHVVLEGLACNAGSNPALAYTLTHREGWLEAAWTIGRFVDEGPIMNQPLVFQGPFERTLSDLVEHAQQIFRGHGVDGPWILMVSLIGMRGYQIARPDNGLTPPTARSHAHLPDVLSQSIDTDDLLTVFKAFSRVFGLERLA